LKNEKVLMEASSGETLLVLKGAEPPCYLRGNASPAPSQSYTATAALPDGSHAVDVPPILAKNDVIPIN
jgi:hypothetical protein